MILEPEQAEMAKEILDSMQDYLKERHESKKEEVQINMFIYIYIY